MGRPRKEPTRTVRIPVRLIPEVLALVAKRTGGGPSDEPEVAGVGNSGGGSPFEDDDFDPAGNSGEDDLPPPVDLGPPKVHVRPREEVAEVAPVTLELIACTHCGRPVPVGRYVGRRHATSCVMFDIGVP